MAGFSVVFETRSNEEDDLADGGTLEPGLSLREAIRAAQSSPSASERISVDVSDHPSDNACWVSVLYWGLFDGQMYENSVFLPKNLRASSRRRVVRTLLCHL